MNKLKFYRTEIGLSQVELSAASGVPRWTIQLMELGTRLPEKSDRERLSVALGLPEDQLFGPKASIPANRAKK